MHVARMSPLLIAVHFNLDVDVVNSTLFVHRQAVKIRRKEIRNFPGWYARNYFTKILDYLCVTYINWTLCWMENHKNEEKKWKSSIFTNKPQWKKKIQKKDMKKSYEGCDEKFILWWLHTHQSQIYFLSLTKSNLLLLFSFLTDK